VGLRIDQYAALHGLSVGAVRKRIQCGQLDAHKGGDHRWYVLDTVARDETGQDTRQDATHDAPSAVAVNASARAQLEAIRDEWLAPLVDRIGNLERENGRLEAERDELRRRAEAAEAERDELRQQAVPQPASAAPTQTTAAATPAPPAPAGGFWQRARRVFGGE
jgi:hypothetical protein